MNKRKYQIGGYVQPANVYNTFAGKKVLKEDSDGGRKALDQGSKAIARGFNWVMGKIGDAFASLVATAAVPSGSATGSNVYANSPMYRYNLTHVQPEAKKVIEKASPYISPSNYIAAITQGSLDPNVGAEVLSRDPRLQALGIIGDIATFKYSPKVVRAVPKTVDRGLAAAGNKGAKGRVVARELAKADKLEGAETVAKAYANDQEIVGPMMKSDGTNSFVWRKNRWVKEGDGLLNARFRADEPNNPHYITQTAPDLPEIPNHTYFMGQTRLPFNGTMGNGLGGNTSTVFTPNLQYNAFRQLHWMEPKVQELGQQYLNTGSLRPILDYYRSASPIEKQQLSTIARQPLYLNSDIPYRYYNDNAAVMRENPIVQKEVNKMTPTERGLFNNSLGWATSNDVGAPVIFNKKTGFGGDKVVGHEGNHAYQQRFPQPQNMQELLERALPAEQTKNVKGQEVPLTGNDKRMMGSAHLNVERGSTIQDARAFIIRQYYQQTGRYPSLNELNNIIDNLSETELTNTIKTTSAYGREYAPLINDFNALREALKYAYKAGGKLIFKYEEK